MRSQWFVMSMLSMVIGSACGGDDAKTPLGSEGAGATGTPTSGDAGITGSPKGDAAGATSTPEGDAGGSHVDPSNTDGTDPDEEDCKAPSEPSVVFGQGQKIFSFRVVGDAVYFIDRTVGPDSQLGPLGGIRKVGVDGSASTLLYTATESQSFADLWVEDDLIYFIMSDYKADDDGAMVYSLPIAGGTPKPVSTDSPNFDELAADIIASEDGFLYVAEGTTISRVEKSTGVTTQIVSLSTLIFYGNQLYDGKLWFSPEQGLDGIAYVSKDSVKATTVSKYSTAGCMLGLSVNAGGVFCGTDRVEENGKKTDLSDKLGGESAMSPPILGKVFLSQSGGRYPIIEADPVSFEHKTLACGNSWPQRIRADSTHVYWVEVSNSQGKEVNAILRAPR